MRTIENGKSMVAPVTLPAAPRGRTSVLGNCVILFDHDMLIGQSLIEQRRPIADNLIQTAHCHRAA
jgi:hypothetical protein